MTLKQPIGAGMALAGLLGATLYFYRQGGWFDVCEFWIAAIGSLSAIAGGLGLMTNWFEDYEPDELSVRMD